MIVSRLHPTAPDTTHPLAERRLLRFAAGGPENAHPELEAMKTEVLNKVQLANAPEARKAMNERIKSAGQDVDAARTNMLEGIATIAKAEFDALTAKGDNDAEQKVKDRFVHAGIDVTRNPDGTFGASKLAIEQTDVAPVTLDAAMEKDLNGLSPAMKAVAQEMLQDAGDEAAGKKIVDTFTALGKNPKAFALLMNLDLAKADLLTSLPAEQKKTIDPILAVDSDLSVMQSVREKFGRVMAQEKPATGAFSNDQMQEMLKPVQDELNKNASKIPTMTDAQLQRFKGQLMLKYGVAIEESGEGAGRTLTASAPSSQWEVFMNKFLGLMAIIGSLQAELQNKGKKPESTKEPERKPENVPFAQGQKVFEKLGMQPNDKGEYVFKADLGSGITDVTYKFLGGEWKWQDNTEPLPQTLTTDSGYNYQPKDAANLTKKQRTDRGIATNIARALGGLKNAKPEDPVPSVETSIVIDATPEVQETPDQKNRRYLSALVEGFNKATGSNAVPIDQTDTWEDISAKFVNALKNERFDVRGIKLELDGGDLEATDTTGSWTSLGISDMDILDSWEQALQTDPVKAVKEFLALDPNTLGLDGESSAAIFGIRSELRKQLPEIAG